MTLNEKIAIVTGGARVIGAATARMLGQRGAKVIVGSLDYRYHWRTPLNTWSIRGKETRLKKLGGIFEK